MIATYLALAFLGAAGLVCFRSVPFVLWAATRTRSSRWARVLPLALLAVCGLALAAFGMEVLEIFVRAPLAVAFFGAVSCVVIELRALARTALGRAALIPVLVLSYVIVPSVAAGGPLLAPTLVMGWDRMLAAYSFAVENACVAHVRRREALFFLVVDPSIAWTDRAVRDASLRGTARARTGGARIARGIAKLSAESLILWGGSVLPIVGVATAPTEQFVVVHGIISGALLFMTLFVAHSGLADVQIGLLALTGMRVSERYDRPYLARSPREFWRRWNVWVGRWARRYVFVPLRTRLQARWPLAVSNAAAVLVTFSTLGLLHDIAFWAAGAHRNPTLIAPGVVAFAIFGVITVGWELALARRDPPRSPATATGRWVELPLMFLVVAAVVWLVHPMLSEGRVPTLPR